MSEPVEYTNEISPICLPDSYVKTYAKNGIVTGWGETQGTGSSNVLRQTTINIVDIQECGAHSDNMLCAVKYII